MKKTMQKPIGIFLSLLMVLSVFSATTLPLRAAGAAAGDIIEYGSYPQTKVTDETLVSTLNDAPKTWTSYNYMTGTNNEDDGLMVESDYMKFADFLYNGQKYRAVTFTKYRPGWLYWPASATDRTMYNDVYKNGYRVNQVYYFKYEPLRWRVLDPRTGYVMCESLIDAQGFCNVIYRSGSNYYNGLDAVNYASDYASSYIREWLNYNFYDTAFTEGQKANIKISTPENGVNDKIYLLSLSDVENRNYGFTENYTSDSESRKGYATDYAKAQGAWVDNPSGGTTWWLTRTKNGNAAVYYVLYSGKVVGYESSVENTTFGIRPVCCLTDLSGSPDVSDFLLSEHIEQGCNNINEPAWTWAQDHTSATAAFPCTVCSKEYKLTDASPVMTTVSEQDCTTPYVVKYTATVDFFGETCTDVTGEITLAPAAGHTYGTEGDARFTCGVCGVVDDALKAAAEAADQLAANKAVFEAYKAEALIAADARAREGDSSACTTCIEGTKRSISGLNYNTSLTLEQNKAAVDGLLAVLDADLAQIRGEAPAVKTVSYVDENGEPQEAEAIVLVPRSRAYGEADAVNWYVIEGTYVGSQNISFEDAQANIILADGADWLMMGTGGYNILVRNGSLNYFAQENNAGTIHMSSRMIVPNGDITVIGGNISTEAFQTEAQNTSVSIHGGVINAQGFYTKNLLITDGEIHAPTTTGCNGLLTITGGEITLRTNGQALYSSGDILISGGTVNAVSTNNSGIYSSGGTVTITGGVVNATGGAFGIQSNYGVYITGGTVTATGTSTMGLHSYGPISLTGGTVNVTGGMFDVFTGGSGLTLGADAPCGYTFNSFTTNNTVTVKEGHTLTDGENSYSGTLTTEQLAAAAGKTLTCKHSCGDQSWTYFDGIQHVRYCAVCGAPEYEAHDVIVKGAGDATCGDDGYTGNKYCSVCGQMLSEGEIIPATGKHDYTDAEWTYFSADQHVRYCKECGAPEYEAHDVIVKGAGDATCGYDGYTGNEYCSVCGQMLSEGEIIPATGNHTTVLVNAKEATATEDGYTGDEVCTVCGQTIKQGEVIPATGDNTPDEPDDGDACPYCGKHHAKKWVLIVHLVLWFLCKVFHIVRK